MEIDLLPDGDGTIIRLVHHGLPGPATEAHRWGWDHYTARLATAATGGDPGPDPALAAG